MFSLQLLIAGYKLAIVRKTFRDLIFSLCLTILFLFSL